MTSTYDLAARRSEAERICRDASRIALEYFEAPERLAAEKKGAQDWVTAADRAVEAFVREQLEATFPGEGFLGEETGKARASDAIWVCDPIDGTSNFVRGIPVWATLVALTHADHGPVVGVVAAPAMGRRWWAARGLGAFANGRRCQVSSVATLEDAQVSVTFASGWDALGVTPQLVQLQQQAYRARGFGDFWQHMLVAEGAVDIAIDAVGLMPYDNAAVKVVVEEAGGTYTDRSGVVTFLSDTAVSSNGLLHAAALAAVAVPAG